jgi:hypothetical protein
MVVAVRALAHANAKSDKGDAVAFREHLAQALAE